MIIGFFLDVSYVVLFVVGMAKALFLIKKERTLDSAAQALAPLASLVLLWAVLRNLFSIPFWDHNSARLIGPFVLKYGFPLYPLSANSPVHGSMIYPPAGALVYWPATWAATPTGALLIGGVINAATFFIPAAVWIFWPRSGKASAPCWRWLGFLAFVSMVMNSEGLSYSAFRIHVDAPGILWATAALYVFDGGLGLGVGMGALAALTKQTFAPVWLFVLPLTVLLKYDRRSYGRFALWMLGSALVAGSFCLLFAAPRNLIADLFLLQAHYAFIGKPWDSLGFALTDFFKQLWPLSPFLALGLFLNRRFAAGPALMLILAAAFVFPLGLVHRAKVGGDVNTYVPVLYWLLLASILGLLHLMSERSEAGSTGTRVAQILLLVTVGVGTLEALPSTFQFPLSELLRILPENPQETAYRYCMANPGKYYFPFNPLSPLMAGGRLYHSAASLLDLELENQPIDRTALHAGLPPHFLGVAIHQTNDQDHEALLKTLGIQSSPQNDPALPGWLIYPSN